MTAIAVGLKPRGRDGGGLHRAADDLSRRSKYHSYRYDRAPVVGALLKLLEERRTRLAAEGLFAAERKKKLPFLPE